MRRTDGKQRAHPPAPKEGAPSLTGTTTLGENRFEHLQRAASVLRSFLRSVSEGLPLSLIHI
eukprot:4649005-Alexandrium_andersonii.AAC.1